MTALTPLTPHLLAHLVAHAREKRRPTTYAELTRELAKKGHEIHSEGLQGSLKEIRRHCEQLELPDLSSLVVSDKTGAPGEEWQPQLVGSERLVHSWEEQAKLWLFDEWLRYEEAIIRLQRLGG